MLAENLLLEEENYKENNTMSLVYHLKTKHADKFCDYSTLQEAPKKYHLPKEKRQRLL